MKEVIIALILGPMLSCGSNHIGKEEASLQPSGGNGYGPPVKVWVTRTGYGPRVVPPVVGVNRHQEIQFMPVNGDFTIKIKIKIFDEKSPEGISEQSYTIHIAHKPGQRTTEQKYSSDPPYWPVPSNAVPDSYPYVVIDNATGLKVPGNSAPVIIIDPE